MVSTVFRGARISQGTSPSHHTEVTLTGVGRPRMMLNQRCPCLLRVSDPRAHRFPIQTGLHYRRVGEGERHRGTTVNVSKSGLLFETVHSPWAECCGGNEVQVELRDARRVGRSSGVLWFDRPSCSRTWERAVAALVAVRITEFHFVRPLAAVGL